MPGSPLPIVYPFVGEPVAEALSRVISAIQILQTDVEAKIVPSEFSWTSDLSAQGHALTSLSKVQLDNIASAAGLATGTVFFLGGEAWVQTGFGAVQVTLNGSINSAGVGGIVGDYGGSNPARVTYTDSTDTYTFTADTNDWSDLEVQAVKFRNNGNWTKLQSDPALNSAVLWQLGAANGTGTALLHQTSAGVVSSGGTVTQNLSMSGSIVLTGSGFVKHGDRTRTCGPVLRFLEAGTVAGFTGGFGIGTGAGGATIWVEVPSWETGERAKAITIHGGKSSVTTLSLEIFKINLSTGTLTSLGSSATAVNGRFNLGMPFGAFETHAQGVAFVAKLTDTTSYQLNSVSLTYDIP